MTSPVSIYLISDGRTGRLLARTVSISDLAHQAAEKAAACGQPKLLVRNGGAVPNTYGYPASTEAALAVAIPLRGEIVVATYAAQIPANKVTSGGSAAAAFGEEARPIWDHRYSDVKRQAAIADVIATARAAIEFSRAGDGARSRRETRRKSHSTIQPSLRTRLAARKLDHLRQLGVRLSSAHRIDCAYGPPSVSVRGWNTAREIRICWDTDKPERIGDHLRIGRYAYTLSLEPHHYLPLGDHRDVDSFRGEQNQERRRLIYAACGDRLAAGLALTELQADEFGTLLHNAEFGLVVRVNCPSTGSTYFLPVPEFYRGKYIRTAHAAVASTFGLTPEEYSPIAQA